MHNHWISMIAAALQTLLSSTVFSLCTLAAFGGLFYRKVKHPLLFPLLFGAGYGLLAILQQQILGGIDLSAMFVIHTVAAFLLVTARSLDHLFSLLLAELFAGSLILSVQTAVFALARGGERGFWAVTLLYVGDSEQRICCYEQSIPFSTAMTLASEVTDPIILTDTTVIRMGLPVDVSYYSRDFISGYSDDLSLPEAGRWRLKAKVVGDPGDVRGIGVIFKRL